METPIKKDKNLQIDRKTGKIVYYKNSHIFWGLEYRRKQFYEMSEKLRRVVEYNIIHSFTLIYTAFRYIAKRFLCRFLSKFFPGKIFPVPQPPPLLGKLFFMLLRQISNFSDKKTGGSLKRLPGF